MSKTRTHRRLRAFSAASIVWALGFTVYDVIESTWWGLPLFLAVAAIHAAFVIAYSRRIRQAELPCPDYSAIARMEREIYGESFGHAGAPPPVQVSPPTHRLPRREWDISDDDAALPTGIASLVYGRSTSAAHFSRGCGALGESGAAHTSVNRPAPAPAFEPLPLERYIAWLKIHVRHGGRISHVYDYSYPERQFVLARRDFTTDGECGALARHILVPAGVKHLGGRLGHCSLYLPDGSARSQPPFSVWTPVYSNPEFTTIPGYMDAVDRDRRERERARRERYDRRYGDYRPNSDLSDYRESDFSHERNG